MSFRVMEGGLSACVFPCFVGYSCGPNIPVGVVGALYSGSMCLKNKVELLWLQMNDSKNIDEDLELTSDNDKELSRRIIRLENELASNRNDALCWTISIVPFIGPLAALIYSKD